VQLNLSLAQPTPALVLEKTATSTVMSLTYGFSWLQEVILYSKITKLSNMEDSFENDAVILFA